METFFFFIEKKTFKIFANKKPLTQHDRLSSDALFFCLVIAMCIKITNPNNEHEP